MKTHLRNLVKPFRREGSALQIKIISRSENEIEFQLIGEDHTFCNPLVRMLLEDPAVEYAGYSIDHPLTRIPTIYVKTKGVDPETVLKRAAAELERKLQEILEASET